MTDDGVKFNIIGIPTRATAYGIQTVFQNQTIYAISNFSRKHFTLHSSPFTLLHAQAFHPSLFTLHTSSCASISPFTLHPSHFTLHPSHISLLTSHFFIGFVFMQKIARQFIHEDIALPYPVHLLVANRKPKRTQLLDSLE
jgi:hypothetical protein